MPFRGFPHDQCVQVVVGQGGRHGHSAHERVRSKGEASHRNGLVLHVAEHCRADQE